MSVAAGVKKKATFKYYAIRVNNTIVIRRTVKVINKIVSSLYKPGTDFELRQISYTGGKAIGTIQYQDFYSRLGVSINNCSCKKLTRENVTGLKPFLYKGE